MDEGVLGVDAIDGGVLYGVMSDFGNVRQAQLKVRGRPHVTRHPVMAAGSSRRSRRVQAAERRRTRPQQCSCEEPLPNETGDPILTIDARTVHIARRHLTSLHNRPGAL